MAKVNLKNIFAYLQGNIRYKIYYSKVKFLIPYHIIDQIVHRIMSMKTECYNNGSCTECGCMTTQLQMCNKACDGNCYPKMLSKKRWNIMLKGSPIVVDDTLWVLEHGKFKMIK